MKFIVYCTTNIVNKKIYIGVHKTENPDKFDGYLGCSVRATQPSTYMNPKTAFQYAVKKYGTDKFSRSILYVYDTAEEAFNKEKELVTTEFIKLDTNYNMIEGGGEYRPTEPVNQFDKNGVLVKHWNTLTDASEFFVCPEKSIKNAIYYREALFDYFWSKEDSIDISIYSKGTSRKPVYKYLKSGKLIREYKSLYEASKYENMSASSLTTAIKGNSLVNKEFYYSFTLYDEFIATPKKSLRGKKFYIYTLEGEYIKTIENSKELMKFMEVKSWSSIWDVINRRNGVYKTFQIKTEFSDKIDPVKNTSLSKQVDVYTKTGEFIKTCESVQKAAKEFGAKASCINRVLRGIANTTAGYVFKFHK